MFAREALLGNALLVVATPAATWWVIGDLSESSTADYFMLKLARWDLADEDVVGLVTAVLAIAGLALVVLSLPLRERQRPQWLPAVGLIVFAEVIAVWSYRVFTAGVVGANIGGGLLLLVGAPVIGGALASAWRRLSTDDESRPPVGIYAASFFPLTLLLSFASLWLALVPIVLTVLAATIKLELRVSRGDW